MNFSDAAVSENVSVQNIERGMAISVTANTARQAAGAHDASASGQGREVELQQGRTYSRTDRHLCHAQGCRIL